MVHVGGFLHVRHVKIAIVVMADVLRIQPRQAVHGCASSGSFLAHVPVGESSCPSGLACTYKLMTSFRKRMVSGIGAAGHLIDHLHELLRPDRFARMQPAVDPDHRFAFARQRMRLLVGQPFGMRQPRRDVLIMIQLLQFSAK